MEVTIRGRLKHIGPITENEFYRGRSLLIESPGVSDFGKKFVNIYEVHAYSHKADLFDSFGIGEEVALICTLRGKEVKKPDGREFVVNYLVFSRFARS